MEISEDTRRKIQVLIDRATEIVKEFPLMTPTEAMLCASSIMTAKEIMELKERADRMDARQEKQITAEKRANAAYASTYKSNIET